MSGSLSLFTRPLAPTRLKSQMWMHLITRLRRLPGVAMGFQRLRRNSVIAVLLAFSLVGLASELGPVSAAFASLTNKSLDGFEVDGNFQYPTSGVTPAGTMDWQNVATVAGSTVQRVDDPFAPASDTIFGQGSKEQSPDGWVFTSGSAPGKDDVTRAYFATDVSSPSKAYLFLGYERLHVSGVGDRSEERR